MREKSLVSGIPGCFHVSTPRLFSLLFQGDRGENGPPGPTGFAGPPVSPFMMYTHQSKATSIQPNMG